MEIDFLKMQGCGEDVVVVDNGRIPPEAMEDMPRIARRMLDRRFGVGGVSLAILGAPDGPVLPIRCFDPDGDETGIPCNAARCVARYAADSGAVPSSGFSLELLGRRFPMQIIDSANVRADMGLPYSGEQTAEIRESNAESFNRSILVEGRSVAYTPVSLGRPYAMLFVPDFTFPVKRTARTIAAQEDFPDQTGIGFVQVISREQMRLRVWEAEGEIPGDICACAASALVASVVNGFTDRDAFIQLKTGEVFLQWEESDNHIRLTGPAGYVFTGTYDAPDLPKE